MIRSLLIANRGEIAVRIMRTCRRLGIRSVAVFSEADRHARHVAEADEAIGIGPAPARDSYLRVDAIIDAALRSGAEAVHPGYGFLSEKVELAAACAKAGLVFIGPSPDCIAAMGPKIGSKLIAAKAGLPSVPGYVGDDQSDARLIEEATKIGYPVMVKASAGGGGRGMRPVASETELAAALDIARREAEAAFGDSALLIEKLVQRPRHLEVQIAGDKHGNVVHLFERDCSVQRNNQKVLEEAPAPNLPEHVRRKLLDRGVALAKAIGYDNLGTVEFILEQGMEEPWFLEMNTRLQVEHPVTESITGFDLVEWQIRIAAGEPLPVHQNEIVAKGHAIEARITAERADAGFRSDIGRISSYSEPATIRIDSGIVAGSDVTMFYDSMLAKAIAYAGNREEACGRLAAGLRETVIAGVATTIPFLIDCIEHSLFRSGSATTGFIPEAFPGTWSPGREFERVARAVAVVEALGAARPADPENPWNSLKGFRLLQPSGGRAVSRVVVEEDESRMPLAVETIGGGRYRAIDDGGAIELSLRKCGAGFEVDSDGRLVRMQVTGDGANVHVAVGRERYTFSITSEVDRATAAGSASGSGNILSKMPGIVTEIRVSPGDRVEAGEVVAVLESMKLFISLTAEVAGVVKEVSCTQGQTVPAGARLLVIEEAA